MGKKEAKTNAMRLLETMQIPYESREYDCAEFTDGGAVADLLGLDHAQVFKTLVAVGADGQHYVFVLPVDESLDFKKCARSVGAKAVQLIHQKELLPLTGYVRGGCTAVGMKKAFPTRIDETAILYDRIWVSAGRVGCQLLLSPEDLRRACGGEFSDLCQQ